MTHDECVEEVKRLAEERRVALGEKEFEKAEELLTEMKEALEKMKEFY